MYFQRLKQRQTLEECIYDLRNFDKRIKYPTRSATQIKTWLHIINPQTYEVKYYMEEHS